MSKARAWSFGLNSKTGFDSFERAELEHFKAWLVSACLQPFKHTIPKDTDALSQTSKFKLVDYHHNHNNSMNLNPNYAANKTEKSATITAGDGDLLLPGRSILLRLLCSGTWNPRSSSSSSYSSPSAACEAMTCARRCAAALAATFWVRLTVENREFGCNGDTAGDNDPVLLEVPLHCLEYTGLSGSLRSIAIYVYEYIYVC